MPGLRLVDVRDSLLRTLGYESSGAASASVLAEILTAMNYARQSLWIAGPDYFTRSRLSLVLVEGTSEYTLDDSVQQVLGPVRLPNSRTLRALGSRSELDNFGMLYRGNADTLLDDAEPQAYFVEGLSQAGNEPSQIRIHVVPAPNAASAGTAIVEGVTECAPWVTGDLASTNVLPIPQQYVEKLFLPIARKHLTSSPYFSATNLQDRIEADFREAMAALNVAGGFPPPANRREPREVEA